MIHIILGGGGGYYGTSGDGVDAVGPRTIHFSSLKIILVETENIGDFRYIRMSSQHPPWVYLAVCII